MPTHSVTNFGTWQFQTLCSHMAVMLRSSCRAIPRATPPSLNPRPTAPCSGTTLGFSYTLATALSPLRAAQGVHFSLVIHLLFLNSSFTGNSHQHDAFTVFSLLPYSPSLSHQTYHPHPLNNHYPYFTFALLNIFTPITNSPL